MNTPIAFRRVSDPFGWLGNMSPHPVSLRETQHGPIKGRTAEHVFQVLRLPGGHPAAKAVLSIASPMAAKWEARKHVADFLYEPRSVTDLQMMYRVVSNKITQHPDLFTELDQTHGREIIEDETARANQPGALFWGARLLPDGSWEGHNALGKIWMEVRLRGARPD